MTHCVSEFRDYVSEGGPDTYPNFWKRFSPSRHSPHDGDGNDALGLRVVDLVADWPLHGPEPVGVSNAHKSR